MITRVRRSNIVLMVWIYKSISRCFISFPTESGVAIMPPVVYNRYFLQIPYSSVGRKWCWFYSYPEESGGDILEYFPRKPLVEVIEWSQMYSVLDKLWKMKILLTMVVLQ